MNYCNKSVIFLVELIFESYRTNALLMTWVHNISLKVMKHGGLDTLDPASLDNRYVVISLGGDGTIHIDHFWMSLKDYFAEISQL